MKSPKWRIRSWSIRAKIITLLLPPLVSLFALWIFATILTTGSAIALLATQTNYEQAGKPADAVVVELQRERKLSLVYIGSGGTNGRALDDQRPDTDKAVAEFRRRASSEAMQDAATGEVKQRLREIFAALDALTAGRQAIKLGQVDRAGAMRLYGSSIDAMYRMYAVLRGIDEPSVGKDSRTVIAMSRARELMAQEDALLNGAVAAGKFVRSEHTELIQTIGAQRFLYAEASAELPAADAAEYQALVEGAAHTQLRVMEERIIADARPNAPVPIDIDVWRSAYDTYVTELRELDLRVGEGIVARARPIGISIFVRLGIAALFGLLAVAVSIVLSIRIGRSLIRRLTGLRQDAQSLADDRLPTVVGRLRQGEEVDVAAAAPALEYGTDEIGELGNAFSAVQRTAVQSAVQEARLRRGLSEVFLNIARRSQTLLHRQLSLLDTMERRSTDPEELEDLFRIDHLATRMRRHAEDLVILAGAAPGRGWRKPVPMLDVIRGAASEVEDYSRVGFLSIPEASLVGRAVADVIHLLAEIIENATSYSPPHTRVQISGQLVPNGFAIEIEDRGLGMSPDTIDEANERLLHPPDFDPTNSARLGLFVVALLAARHGIRVTLRASPYGGVTAVVLVPPHLITDAAAEMTAATAAERMQDGPRRRGMVLELEPSDAVRPTMIDPLRPMAKAAVARQRAAIEPATVPETVAAGSGVAAAGSGAAPTVRPAAARPVEITDDGLPRRHRQANLVPQLRKSGEGDGADDDADASDATESGNRTPEQVRDMMSSFQAGMTRGRRDAASVGDPDPAITPSESPERDA